MIEDHNHCIEGTSSPCLSLLDLPDLVIRRVIECLSFPEYNDRDGDPRDLFHLLTCCRGLYNAYFDGDINSIFEKFYLEVPEYEVYLSRAKPRQSRLVLDAGDTSTLYSQSAVKGKPKTSNREDVPVCSIKYSGLKRPENIDTTTLKPSFNSPTNPSFPFQRPKSLEMTDIKMSLLTVIGLEWIAAFASNPDPNCRFSKSKSKSSSKSPNNNNCVNRIKPPAVRIMERLESYILGVLAFTVSSEMGRWTMLGWTKSKDFMILHGIIGISGREFGCPWVVIGKRHYRNAKKTFDILVEANYTSLNDDGDTHQLWNGYGPPERQNDEEKTPHILS